MKKGLILIGCLMFSLLLFGQDQLEQDFQKANEAFAAKQYVKAIEGYEKILSAGYESVEVYFNLGNSYYKNQQLGRAILNYERGLYFDPGNDDLIYNLKIAESELKDDLSEVPPFFLSRWWKNMVQLASAGTWSVMALLLLWLGVGGLMVWLKSEERSQKKRGFLIGIALILISILPFMLALGKANLDKDTGLAILLEQEIPLRSAPDAESNELQLLHEGTKLNLLDVIGDWYKVRLINGEEGWLPMDAMERI